MKKPTPPATPKMPFQVNRALRDGIETQVTDGLRMAILSGFYKPGDVFSAGLYDATQKPSFISDTTFSADAMPDDYTWYDIGSLVPSDKAMVWFAAAKLPAPGVPLASTRVLVDAIEISRSQGD